MDELSFDSGDLRRCHDAAENVLVVVATLYKFSATRNPLAEDKAGGAELVIASLRDNCDKLIATPEGVWVALRAARRDANLGDCAGFGILDFCAHAVVLELGLRTLGRVRRGIERAAIEYFRRYKLGMAIDELQRLEAAVNAEYFDAKTAARAVALPTGGTTEPAGQEGADSAGPRADPGVGGDHASIQGTTADPDEADSNLVEKKRRGGRPPVWDDLYQLMGSPEMQGKSDDEIARNYRKRFARRGTKHLNKVTAEKVAEVRQNRRRKGRK